MNPRKVAAAPADALSTKTPVIDAKIVGMVVYLFVASRSLGASLRELTTMTTRGPSFPYVISGVRFAGDPGVNNARRTAVRPRLSTTPPSTRRRYCGRRKEFVPARKES